MLRIQRQFCRSIQKTIFSPHLTWSLWQRQYYEITKFHFIFLFLGIHEDCFFQSPLWLDWNLLLAKTSKGQSCVSLLCWSIEELVWALHALSPCCDCKGLIVGYQRHGMGPAWTLGSLFRVRFLSPGADWVWGGNKLVEQSHCDVGAYFVTAASPSLFWLIVSLESSDSAILLWIMWLNALLIFLLLLWLHLLSLPLRFFCLEILEFLRFLFFNLCPLINLLLSFYSIFLYRLLYDNIDLRTLKSLSLAHSSVLNYIALYISTHLLDVLCPSQAQSIQNLT